MTEVGFDGADPDRLLACFFALKYRRDCSSFNRITCWGAGSVSLEIRSLRKVKARSLITSPNERRLSFLTWRSYGFSLSVLVYSSASNDSANGVAVS